MRLSDLKPGQEARIVKILGHGAFRKRLMEMGFVGGHTVKVMLHAPLHDPVKYQIMGYEVSLRRSESSLIEVIPVDGHTDSVDPAASATESHDSVATQPDRTPFLPADFDRSRRTINVALIGNPNCGKTSLFNIASAPTSM